MDATNEFKAWIPSVSTQTANGQQRSPTLKATHRDNNYALDLTWHIIIDASILHAASLFSLLILLLAYCMTSIYQYKILAYLEEILHFNHTIFWKISAMNEWRSESDHGRISNKLFPNTGISNMLISVFLFELHH